MNQIILLIQESSIPMECPINAVQCRSFGLSLNQWVGLANKNEYIREVTYMQLGRQTKQQCWPAEYQISERHKIVDGELRTQEHPQNLK